MDPYQILGLSNNSTNEEVKRAYKKLTLVHHPDKGGSSEKFSEIKNAFDKIMEQEKEKKPTITYNVPTRDFYYGKKNINFSATIQIACLKNKTKCNRCDGRGMIQLNPIMAQQCPSCRGGFIFNCKDCNNKGYTEKQVVESFSIEKGACSGDIIEFKEFLLKLNEKFEVKRNNNDIIIPLKISFLESLIGFSKTIQLFDDNIEIYYDKINIKKKELVLQERGMPCKFGKNGDLVLELIHDEKCPVEKLTDIQKSTIIRIFASSEEKKENKIINESNLIEKEFKKEEVHHNQCPVQ